MSTDVTFKGMSGREASIARRKLMSKGKSALPPASERLRSGFREASMPSDTATAAPAPAPAKVEVAASTPVTKPVGTSSFSSGRAASIARRKMMSLGKGALPPARERVRSGFRDAAMPNDAPVAQIVTEATPAAEVSMADKVGHTPAPSLSPSCAGREAAMKHRRMRSQFGRGEKAQPAPSRPKRQGEISHPPKVPVVQTAASNASVTGLSYAAGRAMTGAEAGHDKPLTGTQYVGGAEGAYRASMGKVGHARTANGQTVSGTMVRSGVQITGDEDSSEINITGNADQTVADDMGEKSGVPAQVASQFQRQSQPHGQSVHGTNLGRSARVIGSRNRDTERPVEQSDKGHAISGTAIGRSVRVTGDESNLMRNLTGSQYLAPASAQEEVAEVEGRADPASGGKVTVSETWGGQKISGPQMEHDERVTGSEHGSCASMTGTPYYGASGAYGWCEADKADAESAKRAPALPRAVTGDVPLNDPMVSGTQRGAERSITGSSYFVQAEDTGEEAQAAALAQSMERFSVNTPQRDAHARTAGDAEGAKGSAITGTFAQGEGKITGNVEFLAAHRAKQSGVSPARARLTGEGAMSGTNITGSAWDENANVTGTEGLYAASRNPTERGASAKGFAGAGVFKSKAKGQQQSSSVTGAVGWTAGCGAAVTLSGGAAG